jgi:hypothetical protein
MSARVARRPYADPYRAGVGLGLVLLASFVLAGRGLGASGAFATAAASAVNVAAPQAAAGNAFLADHLTPGGPLRDWLVVEIVGVLAGGFLSAALARRRYAVSETQLADGGFEKRTRSSFGLFGEVVTRMAPR